MKNLKGVLFSIFVLLYAVGVCIGCVRQTAAQNQSGMYEYLEGAVSGYDVPAAESIKSILIDNVKLLGLLAFGGLLPVGFVVLAGVMLLKGYTAGFAITAMLRLFGVKGLFFCGANLVSAALMIPAISWYSAASVMSLINDRHDKGLFLKKYFIVLGIMLLVLIIDGVLRGFLSSVLMKFASGV